ncbi:MAG: AcvB/VirJ family lysyl-phosphatidylglycerol hydrolase [Bacteroidota bacterium]
MIAARCRLFPSAPRRWIHPFLCGILAVLLGLPYAAAAGAAPRPKADVVEPFDPTDPSPPATPVRDLPIIEIHAAASHGVIAVHLTGDDGYDDTDRGLAQGLANQGVPVIVLDSRKYFATQRTPEGAAADLARILRFYLPAWHGRQFVMSGFSFGADVMPFLLNRLPQDLREKLRSVTLLSPTGEATFHYRLAEWGPAPKDPHYPVVPELERLRGERMLCFYGAEDKGAMGPQLDPTLITCYRMPGGHSIGKRSLLAAEKIVEAIR